MDRPPLWRSYHAFHFWPNVASQLQAIEDSHAEMRRKVKVGLGLYLDDSPRRQAPDSLKTDWLSLATPNVTLPSIPS